MAKHDDGKFKGAFDREPTAKGGRTGSSNNRNRNPDFMKNLKPWRPGEGGNPTGLPKNVREIQALAREMSPRVLEAFFQLLNDESTPARDRIAAGTYIVDRGCGKAPILAAITSEISMGDATASETEGVTALLARARLEQLAKPE